MDTAQFSEVQRCSSQPKQNKDKITREEPSTASKLDEVTSDIFKARLMKATAEAKEKAVKEASQDGETFRQEIALASRLRQQI